MSLSIEEVRNLQSPTTNLVTKVEDNIYGIYFVGFKIRDVETGRVLFED